MWMVLTKLSRFWGVFWIDATTEDSLLQGFCSVAHQVRKKRVTSYPGAKLWLEKVEEPWLLILDNVSDPSLDLSRFIPSGNRGCILITTRNTECDQYGTCGCYPCEKLEFEDAVELLLQTAGLDDQRSLYSKQAQELVGDNILARHALAITHAGAAIKQRLYSIQQYPAEFKRQGEIPFERRAAQAWSICGDVYTTLEMFVVAVESSHIGWIDALRLLEVLAFYHHEKVPEELFDRALAHSVKIKAQAGDNE